MNELNAFWRDNRGVTALEYGLVAAGLLLLVYAAFRTLGTAVANFITGLPALLGFGG